MFLPTEKVIPGATYFGDMKMQGSILKKIKQMPRAIFAFFCPFGQIRGGGAYFSEGLSFEE